MMKKAFFLLTILLFLTAAVCRAHTMTKDDMALFPRLAFGNTLGEAKAVMGEPLRRNELKGDGIRVVIYEYAEEFTLIGRTAINDASLEDERHIVSINMKSPSYTLGKGIAVGRKLRSVEKIYGEGEKMPTAEDGSHDVHYQLDAVTCLTLNVNKDNVITEVHLGTVF